MKHRQNESEYLHQKSKPQLLTLILPQQYHIKHGRYWVSTKPKSNSSDPPSSMGGLDFPKIDWKGEGFQNFCRKGIESWKQRLIYVCMPIRSEATKGTSKLFCDLGFFLLASLYLLQLIMSVTISSAQSIVLSLAKPEDAFCFACISTYLRQCTSQDQLS